MALLNDHFNRIQEILKAEGKAARSFINPVNKGLIREAFIRQFLSKNIAPLWGVGTGEIIHQNSETLGEKRPQIDAVIHDHRHPKLPLAGGIDLYFVETVSSTIEIKSQLKKKHLKKTGKAARRVKQLALDSYNSRDVERTGYQPLPYPYSFLFAYDGPKNIETVLGWVKEMAENDETENGLYDLANTQLGYRLGRNHNFVDGIFVLGKGFVIIDAMARSVQAAALFGREDSPRNVPIAYFGVSQELFMLWILINQGISLRSNTEDVFVQYIKNIDILFDIDDENKLLATDD